jgi:hypothetical protein
MLKMEEMRKKIENDKNEIDKKEINIDRYKRISQEYDKNRNVPRLQVNKLC